MDKNPLTDPTSLIAYRLAHGEMMSATTRATANKADRPPLAFAVVGFGLAASVFSLAVLLLVLFR